MAARQVYCPAFGHEGRIFTGRMFLRRCAMLFVAIFAFSLVSFAALANDTFPGTTISGSGTLTSTNAGATAETGEPTPGGNAAFQPLNTIWYSWTAPSNGILVVDTCGATVTSFDTVLGLFTGSAVGSLTQQAFNDDVANCAVAVNSGYGSSITQTVTSGTVYRIQVDGYGSATGAYQLNYNFTAVQPVMVTPIDSTMTEGGDTGSFSIRLGSLPTGTVTVTIGADSSGQCTFSTATLTFTTANWNVAQTIAATAVNDAIAEGTHTCSTGAITASGGGMTGQTGTAPTFTITDNDNQAVSVLNTDDTATEGGPTGSFTVRLLSAPTANVTVTVGSSTQCSFSPTSLTFTTSNWATAQTVTVTATNDTTPEGTHTCTTGAIVANGGGYVNVAGTAPTFIITDNDQGLVISKTDGAATEGGDTGAFTVALATLPTATVTVTIGADSSGQCTIAPATLTFTTASWSAAQTVTMTAVDDSVVEGSHSCSTGAITAAGGDYVTVTGTAQSFTITDNDTGSLVVTNTTATATEGGATGAFTVRLGLQPSGTVTVSVAADASGQCTFAPTTLSFTTANWNSAQTVTTTAVNDTLVEGTHSCSTGAISASGGSYTGVTGTAPTFTISDNDTGAITVTTTTATATEGGATGAFTVVLTAQPATSVTVTVGTDTSGQCTFASSTLTFTTANWNSAQTVTTTAVNDTLVEGTHSCSTGSIAGSGSGYTGVTGTSPTFTITDNDTGAITVTTTTATATEGGATGAFTVVLTAQPATSVTVTVGTDTSGQCTFASSTLTFTTANWNSAQTVTTTAVNDTLVEGTHSCSTGSIAGSGSGYTGVTGTAPSFSITDNDTGTIIVTTTVASATEGGANGAFTVALGLQPSGTVTVTIGADAGGQCVFAPTTLTFTTADWNTAQTVTTTAVDDLLVEAVQSCATGAIAASGGAYGSVTGTAPTFTISDNDIAAIALNKSANVTIVAMPGDAINYTIQVSNTGNVPATGLVVSDTLVTVTCPTSGTNTIATLAPAASESCSASYAATQADFDGNGGGDGDIDNSASVTGTAGGVSVNAADSEAVLCTQVPAMTMVKTSAATTPLTAGQSITYEFVVKNTGNVTLTNVAISEDAFNGSMALGIPADEALTDNAPFNTVMVQSQDSVADDGTWSELKPNDEVTFSVDYVVPQGDIDTLQ